MLPDYSKEENLVAANNTLAELSQIAEELDRAEKEVGHRKLELSRAEARVKDLREIIIPDMMKQVGLKNLRTNSGLEVSVEDEVYARISRENEVDAFAWLDDNGHGGMIKRKVTVEFSRDQEDAVKDLVKRLRGTYPQTKEERKVEWQTLRAWVKRRFKEGEPTPGDLFGVHTRPVASIKRTKK